MEVYNRLAAVLGGAVKPMITQCSISHLVNLASDGSQVAQEAVDLARNICERRKCNHWKTKASSVECIKGILGDTENRLRYIICTQDLTFRKYLRENIVGVPIVYVNRSGALILEEEGPATELKRKQLQEEKLHVPREELEELNSTNTGLSSSAPVHLIQRTSTTNSEQTQPVASTSTHATASAHRLEAKLMKKKKRKTGGPNPLSVKKKKSSTTNRRRIPKAKAASTKPPAPSSSKKPPKKP